MKTFGLVQKGNGKPFKKNNAVVTLNKSNKAKANNGNDVEAKHEDVQQRQLMDDIMGFTQYNQGPEKLGWLVNMHATVVYDYEGDPGKSGLDLYFIEEQGSTFKATVLYKPYMYLVCKPGTETEVEEYIKRRFGPTLDFLTQVDKEDLSLANHLMGNQSKLLKLVFTNNTNMMNVRKVLGPIADRNKKQQETVGIYEEAQQLASFSDKKKTTKSTSEALENILELREFDIQYYIRVAIDRDLRVGQWFTVKASAGELIIDPKPEKINRPDPVILAFDIETTKLPLKFPDASFDSIMMISYMIDGQGFLITNREIVSEDILDFEYTPKPEFEGPFIIFNEENELGVLNRFFEHIRETKPSVFVTYNGDFFDFPFIDARCQAHGLDMKNEIGFYKNSSGEYTSYHAMHMDCFCWVKRDSYLPQGSQGLKAVTTAKLGYNPMELDPEDMTRFASQQPQTLAQYSVSDAVATYYLYMKYVHPFIFSLCNIIPMNPDDVLRRGSGTLCEHLLMVQAYKANVIMPNKHMEDSVKFFKGHLLESETYVGGHVEALEAGVFRSDIPTQFRLIPSAFQQLIDEVDQALTFSITVEEKKNKDDILNYDEVKCQIVSALEHLRDNPNRVDKPLIYHLDVAAMYPNIILTNRLQPDAVIDESVCASCDFNQGPGSSCQRNMEWSWRGEYFPAKRNEYNMIRNQLEQEKFPGRYPNDPQRSFHDMSNSEKNTLIKKRLSDYSRKVYNRIHENTVVGKESIVCQREHPFYINTVKDFRDRRYEYKGKLKDYKKMSEEATNQGDTAALDEAKKMIVVYDSLQLAHKCILNSFYGYVMRKGARWYSMEMAGIVCLTGSKIIQLARSRVEQIGRPLELDTDGIWCIMPSKFPECFTFKLKNGKSFSISYPCVMLNHLVHDQFTNHQYQELQPDNSYSVTSENSIFFEVDGPYKAMILPSSTEEDKLLKKRYAVFNDDGTLAELKGFELKRRGELKLIKIFQKELFSGFLKGDTLEECYQSVAVIADQWLDILYSRGAEHTDEELFDLISENRSMSKSLEEYGSQKSTAISTAKRLAEFLGDQMVKDKGLNCKFIISSKPIGAPVSERAIPIVIFQAEPAVRKHFLCKWLKDNSGSSLDIREILDWQYYLERFGSVIQKLITIPAAMQGVSNPVPRIHHPDWLSRKISNRDDKIKQIRITDMFKPLERTLTLDQEVDMEDFPTIPMPSHIHPIVSTQTEVVLKKSKQPMPDMYTRYHEWIQFQKVKWKKQRQARLKEKQLFGTNKTKKDSGISKFLQKQTIELLTQPWHILQIASTDSPGEFKVWALVKEKIYCLKLMVPRVFYVNSLDSQYDLQSNDYSVLKVNKSLPRSQSPYYLYEFTMKESFYIQNQSQFSTLFNHEKIEGVYETNVPLLMRSLFRLGCVVSVQKRDAEKANESVFELSDLQHEPKSSKDYLIHSLNYLYLIHSSSENGTRQVFGLFSIPNQVLYLFIVDPALNRDAIPNTRRMYQDKIANLIHTDSETLFEYPSTFEVKVSTFTGEKEAANACSLAIIEYQDLRKGPTLLALQSMYSSQYLHMLGVATIHDFPIISVPFHKKDSMFPVFGWQSFIIKRMLEHFLNLNTFLSNRLELARYGDVPICNIEHDYTLFLSDLFFARRLKKADMLLWYSESELPDLGGREKDDNKHDLEELVNPEINVSGTYSTVCIELDVWDLALNTLLQSNMFNEFEASLGAIADTKVSGIQTIESHLERQFQPHNSRSIDESRISSVAFGILRNMIRGWSDQVCKRNKIASLMLEQLYRWITSCQSRMYDPALYSLVYDLMKRVFVHLIAELRNFGSQIVYATFSKMYYLTFSKNNCQYRVLATTKNQVSKAIPYVNFLINNVKNKEMFLHIDLKPTQVWEYLIWMDHYNYCGLLCDEEPFISTTDSPQPQESGVSNIDFKWNLAEYLPFACQRRFLQITAEYMYEIQQFNLKLYQNQENTEFKRQKTGKESEEFNLFLRKLVSTGFKRKLLSMVKELQKQELYEQDPPDSYDFPQLAGSHLTLKNPALEFIKLVSEFFSLDANVSREARLLRRDMLNLIGMREFSQETLFVNPCESFTLSQVICDFCNDCRDLDLTRGEDANVSESMGDSQSKLWSCTRCNTFYDTCSIEQRLVNIVRKRLLVWQLQDLKCDHCKLVRAEEIRDHCSGCSGKLNTELSRQEFIQKTRVFNNLANYHEMPMLRQVMEWVMQSL